MYVCVVLMAVEDLDPLLDRRIFYALKVCGWTRWLESFISRCGIMGGFLMTSWRAWLPDYLTT